MLPSGQRPPAAVVPTPSLDVALYCHSTLSLCLCSYMLACAARCLHLTLCRARRCYVAPTSWIFRFVWIIAARLVDDRQRKRVLLLLGEWCVGQYVTYRYFLCRCVSLVPYAAGVASCRCHCREACRLHFARSLALFIGTLSYRSY